MKIISFEVIVVSMTIICIVTPTLGVLVTRLEGSSIKWKSGTQGGERCITPEFLEGTCVRLSDCSQEKIIVEGSEEMRELHISCGTRKVNREPIVCCTRPLKDPPSTSTTTTTTITIIPETTLTTTTPEPTSTTSISSLVDLRSNSCLLVPGVYGECIDIKRCPSILNQLKAKGNDPELVKFIKASNLLCDNVGQNVCCPTEPAPRRLPTEKEGCGEPNLVSFRKIVGGDEAMKGAYPWIALLGYGDSSLSIFKCGGTLITARHVVTAAHCIKDNLSFVRLGEHDLSTDTDTTHMDINIVKNVSHSNYNKTDGRSDIAMLYLERNVEFTNIMKPICLPNSPSLRAKSYVDTNPIVIGWGNTQEFGRSAKILRQLMIPVLENSVCQNSYKALNLSFSLNQFDKAILCAGTLAGGEDSCQGDSGGPLMTSEQLDNGEIRFYLIGIVAYGYGCARPNSPGIYTSTQYFMDWINDKVREMS
ncbi:venom serine protease Bi-VSP-like isoform X5 [Drosophila albomicans]|uniref:CLIP domain-containing serine protease n=1 Tax=Drosophila albomicans TaxID=7291 RepID=A0A9C6WJG8_DROAB|nr:venom serine protease Bi-VSP-like isoform X5 [Drosophila albomicans]